MWDQTANLDFPAAAEGCADARPQRTVARALPLPRRPCCLRRRQPRSRNTRRWCGFWSRDATIFGCQIRTVDSLARPSTSSFSSTAPARRPGREANPKRAGEPNGAIRDAGQARRASALIRLLPLENMGNGGCPELDAS